ncbi:nucleotidyltransferase family protein [Polaribacter ponticola]|uniref:Nucleotidyltransferase family protein n=1 Tax=Polaribacter ponticola TaxID=2978475 RepID=A0ABT5S9H2_9FLAO|nr:nucleotidyltransferase family protein [Polaribacter sp. MSW5]MDD7914771.1 nucleotidyltransferase family protein [Polaribacter sp. MSW5]
MDYKETLFFIAKCLTINHEKHNLNIIKKLLESHSIDWDSVVRISTSHYVFSALYSNLKKAKLLDFLPSDLVEYMQHITNLNRERNLGIKNQAKELNQLLINNNIKPIFLKGVGHLFDNLYADVGERMIADIDFIVSKDDYFKTIKLVENFGYTKVEKNKHHSPSFKHYPRLQKENCYAAVEIHKELLIEKFASELNYKIIKKEHLELNKLKVLGYNDQLVLSILSNQINDDGFYIKNLTLKHAYDAFLLSKKTNTKKAIQKFNKLKHPLNCYLASSYQVFNKIETLAYDSSVKTEKYLSLFNKYLVDHKKRKRDYKRIKYKLYLIRKKDFILKIIFYKEYRNWFINDFLIKLNLKKLAS